MTPNIWKVQRVWFSPEQEQQKNNAWEGWFLNQRVTKWIYEERDHLSQTSTRLKYQYLDLCFKFVSLHCYFMFPPKHPQNEKVEYSPTRLISLKREQWKEKKLGGGPLFINQYTSQYSAFRSNHCIQLVTYNMLTFALFLSISVFTSFGHCSLLDYYIFTSYWYFYFYTEHVVLMFNHRSNNKETPSWRIGSGSGNVEDLPLANNWN